jgi:broad specificity phosphatase PhoE
VPVARLHLIRHAPPVVEPDRPPADWRLGEDGRARAAQLAARLVGAGIRSVVTSAEAKARDTAEVIAAALGVPVGAAGGLHEQRRDGAPFLTRPGAFEAAVRELFARPAERVFGPESADEAHARFETAVGDVARRGGPVAIVSHGAVIALFVARRAGLDPFEVWRSLAMPSCAVLEPPAMRLVEIIEPASPVERVEPPSA